MGLKLRHGEGGTGEALEQGDLHPGILGPQRNERLEHRPVGAPDEVGAPSEGLELGDRGAMALGQRREGHVRGAGLLGDSRTGLTLERAMAQRLVALGNQ